MSAAELGRIVLIATTPDRNVRLTHDEGDALARELLRVISISADLLAALQMVDRVDGALRGYELEEVRAAIAKALPVTTKDAA